MKQVPHHIEMIEKLAPKSRTSEENQMLHDYHNSLGDYAQNGTFPSATTNVAKIGGKPTWGDQQSKGGWNAYKRCYEDHPALPIVLTEYQTVNVYGGSCSNPIPDMDIYVGLDYSMKAHKSRLPWEPGVAIHYEIQDMGIPKDLPEFKKLIFWLSEQITNGKKVHIGCIGGHGRTGTVLAALVAHMTDEPDPIAYVRKNYCKKAVESATQIKMLVKEFGCKTATGTKQAAKHTHKGTLGSSGTSKKLANTVNPIQANHCLWDGYIVE